MLPGSQLEFVGAAMLASRCSTKFVGEGGGLNASVQFVACPAFSPYKGGGGSGPAWAIKGAPRLVSVDFPVAQRKLPEWHLFHSVWTSFSVAETRYVWGCKIKCVQEIFSRKTVGHVLDILSADLKA